MFLVAKECLSLVAPWESISYLRDDHQALSYTQMSVVRVLPLLLMLLAQARAIHMRLFGCYHHGIGWPQRWVPCFILFSCVLNLCEHLLFCFSFWYDLSIHAKTKGPSGCPFHRLNRILSIVSFIERSFASVQVYTLDCVSWKFFYCFRHFFIILF